MPPARAVHTRGMGEPEHPPHDWADILARPRSRAADIVVADVPSAPGVHLWYHDSSPVYLGRAATRGGVRARLRLHLGTGLDLSRSSFRRNVCDHLLGIPTAVTRQRPTVMRDVDVSRVNAWISASEVAWMTCESPEEDKRTEAALLTSWKPPLNRR